MISLEKCFLSLYVYLYVNVGWSYMPFFPDASWPGFLYCLKYLGFGFVCVCRPIGVWHRFLRFLKSSRGTLNQSNIEILDRTRPGKMARMVTLVNVFPGKTGNLDGRIFVLPHIMCSSAHLLFQRPWPLEVLSGSISIWKKYKPNSYEVNHIITHRFSRWSLLQNTRFRGRGWIQIQLLPPYIYLNLTISTPWSLNTRIFSTP